MPESKPQMETGQLALPPLQNTSAPTPRLCQKRTSPLKPGKAPPESDGALSTPSTKLAPGAQRRADAECNVDFLGLREIRERGQGGAGKGQKDGNTQCLFQSKPPVLVFNELDADREDNDAGAKRFTRIYGPGRP